MAREIKFRAWDFKSGQMFEVNEIRMRGNAYTVSIVGFSDSQWLTPERNAVMQFTGLKDKNGKEIYEGDIVSCVGGYEDDEDESPRVVSWDDSQLQFMVEDIPLYEFDLDRVIGNIYENPDLIK